MTLRRTGIRMPRQNATEGAKGELPQNRAPNIARKQFAIMPSLALAKVQD